MKTNILALAITLTLGVILTGSILVPAINDASDDMRGVKTFVNPDSIAPYREIASGDHLYWTPTEITLNDETIEGNRTTENWLKCENVLGAGNQLFMCKSDYTVSTVSGLIYCDVVIHEDLSATVTYEIESYTGTVVRDIAPMDWGFIIANEGNWCQVKYDLSNTVAYFNSLDQVYTSGPGGVMSSSKGTTVYWKGTAYEGGMVFTGVEQVANDVYSLDFGLNSLAYDVTGLSGDIRVIVVPASVNATPVESSAADLLGVIPILVIISLVLAAVGAIFIRRND